MTRPHEYDALHLRLLKCTLEVDDSRAYWQRVDPAGPPATAERAFEEYWFGARSLLRIEDLLRSFRLRYDAYPEALEVLRHSGEMDPATRRLVCHWHLQLADPLYRRFTGDFLVARHEVRPQITRDVTVKWLAQYAPDSWAISTRIQLASKLLSAAYGTGLVLGRRDPRPLAFPRVGNAALAYLMYLLRGVDFKGSLLENPYAASVGLSGRHLEERLRGLPGLEFRRQGDLTDFSWSFPNLGAWGGAYRLAAPSPGYAAGAR